MITNDPIRDFLRHDAEQESAPCIHCEICGLPLYNGEAYYKVDEMELCPECMISEYRKVVDLEEEAWNSDY